MLLINATDTQEVQDMKNRINQLEAEKTANAKTTAVARCKVSPKGALSFYGVGRFPATFYPAQWEIIFANAALIQKFAADNAASFAVKTAKTKEDRAIQEAAIVAAKAAVATV